MPLIGRLRCQFAGLIRSSPFVPAFHSDQRLVWNIDCRLYSRKSNAAKRAKKAELRALEKKDRTFSKASKIVKPFPVDICAEKEPPTDNVWFQQFYPLNQLSFEEAISYHRESVHETVYNQPGSFVNVVAVLNLKTKKEKIVLDKLKGSYMPPHIYPSGRDMRILAICNAKEDIEESLEAGALTAGGLELIRNIEEGNLLVEEYDVVVAHIDVMTNLAPIRGLMKTKMPRANLGTLGRDMTEIITKVKESRSYSLVCDSEDKNLGWVDDTIGKLSMNDDHLKENLHTYLQGILNQQPRAENLPFIKDLYVKCPATDEVFLLNRSTVVKEEIRESAGNKKEVYQELITQVKREIEEEE